MEALPPLASYAFFSMLTSSTSLTYSYHPSDKTTGSMERDENYVPKTRSELGLKPASQMKRTDYQEIFEETPIFTLGRMIVMQTLGWQLYLTFNTLGSPMYPAGTNVCPLFLSRLCVLSC